MTDWLAKARELLGPELAYYDQQSDSAVDRGKNADVAMGRIYQALYQNIMGTKKSATQDYNKGINAVGAAYQGAQAGNDRLFRQDQQDQMGLLAQLGIGEAAPDVMKAGNENRALFRGIMGANSQATQNMLRTMKQGAMDFTNEQGNIARMQGAEAKDKQRLKLEDILAQIGGQRAQVEGRAGNMAYQMEQDAAAKAMQQQQMDRQNEQFQYQIAKDLADREAAAEASRSKALGTTPDDPMGKVNALAQQLYGNSQAAGNAVNSITDAWRYNAPEIDNPMELFQVLMDRLRGANGGQVNDADNLRRLVALMYGELNGKGSTGY